MSYVSLTMAKDHLLVIHDEDDTYIQQCIDAAENWAANYMNRPSIEGPQNSEYPWDLSQDEVTSNDEVPAGVVQAILILVGEYYENRTMAMPGHPQAVEQLLHFHRVCLGV